MERDDACGRAPELEPPHNVVRFPLPKYFDWADECEKGSTTAWLVDEVIQKEGIGFLVGKTKMGKSFLVIHLALCNALALPFFGREISTRGGTVIVAAEGAASVGPRLKVAFGHAFDDAELPIGAKLGNLPIVRLSLRPDLQSEEGIVKFIEDLQKVHSAFMADTGFPLNLVVFETFAATFDVRNEDKASEVSAVTRVMQRVATTLGLAVLTTHHFGKDRDRGARGSSAFEANPDFVMTIPSKGKLYLQKCRDALDGIMLGTFDLPVVSLRVRPNGKIDTSRYVVAVPTSVDDFNSVEAAKPTQSRYHREAASDVFMESLKKVQGASETEMHQAVSCRLVRSEFDRRWGRDKSANRQAFNRALRANSWRITVIGKGSTKALGLPTGQPAA